MPAARLPGEPVADERPFVINRRVEIDEAIAACRGGRSVD